VLAEGFPAEPQHSSEIRHGRAFPPRQSYRRPPTSIRQRHDKMPAAIAGLVERKEDLRRWIWKDKLTVLEVIKKLETDYNVVCRKRTLERNLRNWGISKRSKLNQAAIQEELTRLFHGPYKTDRAISEILNEAGHVINKRTVMETRKKLGLHKRLRPEADEQELQNTIKDVLTTEFQDEKVLKMQRSELYDYLRQKYPDLNLVGRDRVYNIAREMNPQAKRRYQKGHPLYQNRPYKLSGKRLAAKLAKDAAEADANPATDHDHGNQHEQDSPAPAEEPYHDTPPMAHDYHHPPTHDAASESPAVAQDYQPSPIYPPVATNQQVLHPSLRVQDLEKENDALHQRLQQQDAEIRYMRQAYHDMVQRLGSIPAPNSYST
jgi:transposase